MNTAPVPSPLPNAALNQHIAILGKTGSGKTYTAKWIVEGLLNAGRQVVIIDPTGAWWGLRCGSDGKPKGGLNVLLIGGDRADVPLAPGSGAAVANLVTSQRVSVVVDVSVLGVGERARWFIDFGQTIYRNVRAPLTLVLDEVHLFAPQGKVPDPDTGKMLHAANTLFSGGRSRGIRLVGISQRPAKWHKDSLTCVDTLIAMRMIAPQDRAAVKEWILGCADAEKGKDVLESLAQLAKGEGWIWFPEGGLLERRKFPRIQTFDSSATPRDDAGAAPPVDLKTIDIASLRQSMETAIQEAEANDPKKLRQRIAELERVVKTKAPASIDQSAIDQAVAETRHETARHYLERIKTMEMFAGEQLVRLDKIFELANPASRQSTLPPAPSMQLVTLRAPAKTAPAPRPTAAPAAKPASQGPAGISSAQQRVLDACQTVYAATGQWPERNQLGWWAGIKPSGGYFNNTVGPLVTSGLIVRDGDRYILSRDGEGRANAFESSRFGGSLARMLSGAQLRMVRVLHDQGEHWTDRATLGASCEPPIDPSGGYFNNTIGPLVTGGLVERNAGSYRLAPWMKGVPIG